MKETLSCDEIWLPITKYWQRDQLLGVLTNHLIPAARCLDKNRMILTGERGKAAHGPYPPIPREDVHGSLQLPGKIDSYHEHTLIELVYGFAGTGEIALDGKCYRLNRGDYAFLPPGIKHQERVYRKDQPYQMIWIGLYNQINRLHLSAYNKEGKFELISGGTLFNCTEICGTLREATGETNREGVAWAEMTCARLIEGLVLMARHIERHGLQAANQDLYHMVDRVKSFINQHYAETLTLKEIADQVYLSPNYCSSLFSEATKQTVSEYIQQVRIKHACQLLQHSEIPVKEVGRMTGFQSSTYFTRNFKRHTGHSPSVFRKQFVKATK